MGYLKEEITHSSYGSLLKDEMHYAPCLAGESQAIDLSGDHTLLCNEVVVESCDAFGDLGPNNPSRSQDDGSIRDIHQIASDAPCGIDDLIDLELDTPPDFQLSVSPLPCFFPLSCLTACF